MMEHTCFSMFLVLTATACGMDDPRPDGCNGRWYNVDRPRIGATLHVVASGTCTEADCGSVSACSGYTIPGGTCTLTVTAEGVGTCVATIRDNGCYHGFNISVVEHPDGKVTCEVNDIDTSATPL